MQGKSKAKYTQNVSGKRIHLQLVLQLTKAEIGL